MYPHTCVRPCVELGGRIVVVRLADQPADVGPLLALLDLSITALPHLHYSNNIEICTILRLCDEVQLEMGKIRP